MYVYNVNKNKLLIEEKKTLGTDLQYQTLIRDWVGLKNI